MATLTAPLTFGIPSRTGGPAHVISVDGVDLTPTGCTCQAGQRNIVCWAVLELAAGPELRDMAIARWEAARGMDPKIAAAAVIGKTTRNRAKAQAELDRRQERHQEQRIALTDLGRDMVARLRAWDHLGITPSAALEVTVLASLAVAA